MNFSEELLVWFESNQRKLPWRETKDPYKIWISEIILQQTRVEQGIPYFYKFIEKFSDVKSLAVASEQEVLKMWEGLGYYSRARNMLFAAKQIVNDYSAIFPHNYQEIIKLKGIGKYTASAILSIAFEQHHAVVDGNVQRVLSRVYEINVAINSSKGVKLIDRIADGLLPKKNVGDYNQAIMELGAMICTPKSPKCEICPVSSFCGAFISGETILYPIKEKKVKVVSRYFNYVFLIDNGYTYIKERVKGDIWQGLWEPLLIECENEQLLNVEHVITSNSTLNKSDVIYESKIIIHQLTHRKIFTRFYLMAITEEPKLTKAYYKVSMNQLSDKAFPMLIRNFIDTIEFENFTLGITN